MSDQINTTEEMVEIPKKLYDRLNYLGLIPNKTRSYNIGASNYAERLIQPWSIWLDWGLDPWDSDIIKRVGRVKKTDPRKLDYQKIQHVCSEKIRQIDFLEENNIQNTCISKN